MSRNSNYLGTQRCCYSKTPVTGAQGAQGARGPIGPFGLTGPTGPKGATGSSLWITTNAIGPQWAGYTGIGVTGIDVLIGGNLLVTGGIDPTYLALTPQPSGPQGFINPLWLDNNGNLRSDKILLDTIDPNKIATLTGTELSIVDNTLGFGNEIFSSLTSTNLLVRNNQGIGGDPYYTNISTTGIIIQANDGSNIQGSLGVNNLTLANYDKSTIIDPYSFTVSDIASGEKSELRSTQLAITNSATSNIYTFGATGTQCQIDSSADNLVLNSGLLILNNIPTSNPGVIGAVWNDGGFLKIV